MGDECDDHTFGIEQVKVCANLEVNTPKTTEDSWFSGYVTVHLREGVYGKSTGILHAAELCVDLLNSAVRRLGREQSVAMLGSLPKDPQGCPIIESLPAFDALPTATQSAIRGCLPDFLAISTDGGSDHINLLLGNQIALWLLQEYLRIPSVVRARSRSSTRHPVPKVHANCATLCCLRLCFATPLTVRGSILWSGACHSLGHSPATYGGSPHNNT